MSDPYGLSASGLPPELIAKLVGSQGQKAIAEAMLKQSMQPLEAQQAKGRFQGVVSPLEAIAKVIQGGVARSDINSADRDAGDIARQADMGRKQAMGEYQAMAQGAPGVTPLTPNDDEGNPMPSTPAVPGDRRKAIVNALSSPYLKNSPFIKMEMDDLNRDEARKDTQAFQNEQKKADREARMDLLAERIRSEEAAGRRADELKRELFRMGQDSKEHLMRLAASMRPERPEPAPSYTEVVDPKDPTRILRVDGRLYRPGGSLGDPGVLGVSSKEPAAAAKALAVDAGRQGVNDVVSDLRKSYDALDTSGGITNPAKGGVDNFMAGVRSSAPGQAAGRVLGTADQSERNNILQARPLLMQAVMKATGMTSKQLDSNAELKLWLATATDPSLDVKANRAALDRIEKMFGMGAAPAKAPAAPEQRRVVDW